MTTILGDAARQARPGLALGLAALLLAILPAAGAARAEPVVPAEAVLRVVDGGLDLEIRLPAEAMLAGIDLSRHADTATAPEVAALDTLRALPPVALEERFRAFWPALAADIVLRVDGRPIQPEYRGLYVAEAGDPAAPRLSRLRIGAPLPPGAARLEFGWAARLGALALTQAEVAGGWQGLVPAGALSPPIVLAGRAAEPRGPGPVTHLATGAALALRAGALPLLLALGVFLRAPAGGALVVQAAALALGEMAGLVLVAAGWVAPPAGWAAGLAAVALLALGLDALRDRRPGAGRLLLVAVAGLPVGALLARAPAPDAAALALVVLAVLLVQACGLALAAVLAGRFADRDGYRAAVVLPGALVLAGIGLWRLVQALA